MKAALIGCGRMGRNHAEALKDMGITNLCAVDYIYENASNVAGMFSQGSAYSDYKDMLIEKKPELVCIATTADSHELIALSAMECNAKFICIEKPVCTSLASSQALIQKSLETNARVAINHQMRFLPQYLLPKKLLKTSDYSGCQSMNVAAGNFGFAMNGTHYIEAFRVITNDNPCTVSAWFDESTLQNPRGPQFSDVSGTIRVTNGKGQRLYIDASANQGHGVQVTYMARNGRITIDELTGRMTTVVRQPEHREAPTSRYGMPVDIEEHKIKPVELVDSTKAVLEALIKGENYPTLHDGTLAVKTLIAAYHSHRKGGIPVKIADIPDNDPEVFPWA